MRLSTGFFLPLRNIVNLCLTSKRFNEVICDNEYFWRLKFIKDYKFVPNYTGNWKHLYKNFRNVVITLDNPNYTEIYPDKFKI
jgi:hypothetical protein